MSWLRRILFGLLLDVEHLVDLAPISLGCRLVFNLLQVESALEVKECAP